MNVRECENITNPVVIVITAVGVGVGGCRT